MGISVDTMLSYVRALSKVYADYFVTQAWIGTSGTSRVYSLAPGSATLTSDYDLELVGPGAHDVARA